MSPRSQSSELEHHGRADADHSGFPGQVDKSRGVELGGDQNQGAFAQMSKVQKRAVPTTF